MNWIEFIAIIVIDVIIVLIILYFIFLIMKNRIKNEIHQYISQIGLPEIKNIISNIDKKQLLGNLLNRN